MVFVQTQASPPISKTDYLYNGKELQHNEFGAGNGLELEDYGARMYDPQVGRWTQPDDFGEITYNESPFCYVGSNPVQRIDPDGNTWGDIIAGLAIGAVTNVIPGTTSLRESYTPSEAGDYNSALRTVDNSAAVIGAGAMILGADEMAAGGSVALAGAVSIVGLPAAAAGGSVVLSGAVTVGVGSMLMSNSAANQKAGYDYGKLKEPRNVGDGKKTTSAQRKRILEENKKANNGQLKSDGDGRNLDPPSKNVKGQKANMNQAEVDHIKERSKGGSNSNTNLRVLSKEENLDRNKQK